jgi:hypothetical protein
VGKPGDDYQEVVAAVQRALDPGAVVKIGQWIEGPDGQRDLDVEVRGTRDGVPYFTLIECKDWKRPVGIEVVDGLESKRHDLAADLALIYSNSGFTAPAIRKATRVGIGCASAMASGDQRIRLVVERDFIAKKLSVDRWKLQLFFPKDETPDLPEPFNSAGLRYQGLPVVNWLHRTSAELLQQQEGVSYIAGFYAFRDKPSFELDGQLLALTGLGVHMWCSIKWLSQCVKVDVTQGLFDHITRKIIVPDQQSYELGWFDNQAWREIDGPPPNYHKELPSGEFEFYLTLLNPIGPKVTGKDSPDIDSLIAEKEVKTAP